MPLIAGATAIPDIGERARRLHLFCEAYGLPDQRGLIDAIRARVIYVGKFIEDEARRDDPGMMRLVAEDIPRNMFVNDVGYLDEHRVRLEGG